MSDTTTKPEAWDIHEFQEHDDPGDVSWAVVVPPSGEMVWFWSLSDAEAFARTPIDRWERDRAVEWANTLRDALKESVSAVEQLVSQGFPIPDWFRVHTKAMRTVVAASEGGER